MNTVNPLTKGVRPFSRDRLYMLPRDTAAAGAMGLLHHVQDEAPEVAMGSVALLFAAWCRRLGVDPQDMHRFGQRLLEPEMFHRKGNVQIEVIRDFAGCRLAGDPRVEAN